MVKGWDMPVSPKHFLGAKSQNGRGFSHNPLLIGRNGNSLGNKEKNGLWNFPIGQGRTVLIQPES